MSNFPNDAGAKNFAATFIPFTRRELWWRENRRTLGLIANSFGWSLLLVFFLFMLTPSLNWMVGESLWELCRDNGCHQWRLRDLLQ